MYISPTQYNVNVPYKAKTKIIASTFYVPEKAVKDLVEIGSKIGDDKSSIIFSIEHVKNNPYAYRFSQQVSLKKGNGVQGACLDLKSSKTLVTQQCSPAKYCEDMLGKIEDIYRNL